MPSSWKLSFPANVLVAGPLDRWLRTGTLPYLTARAIGTNVNRMGLGDLG